MRLVWSIHSIVYVANLINIIAYMVHEYFLVLAWASEALSTSLRWAISCRRGEGADFSEQFFYIFTHSLLFWRGVAVANYWVSYFSSYYQHLSPYELLTTGSRYRRDARLFSLSLSLSVVLFLFLVNESSPSIGHDPSRLTSAFEWTAVCNRLSKTRAL